MGSTFRTYASTVQLGATPSNDSRRGGTTIVHLPRVALLSFWGAFVVASLNATCYGQAVKPEERNARAQPGNEQVRSTEGPIFRAGALEGVGVRTSDSKDAGRIEDLVLDLDTGRVTFVVLGGQVTGDGTASVVVPMSLLGNLGGKSETLRLSSEQVQTAPHIPKSPSELTRAWADVVLSHFSLAPYWKTEKDQVNDRDLLVRASSLRNVAVVDDDGKPLGRINDFAITSRGDIAYAGLAQGDKPERLHPVPASAFIVPAGNTEWKLNLPQDIVNKTPTFAVASWPKTLDRGWLEYVHVRYGRSVFDGVNRTARPNQARTEN